MVPSLPALGAGAVVRDHHDHRVVAVADVVDEVQHAADLPVGVRKEGCETLHEPLGQRPFPLVEAVPARDPGGARRHHRALGDDAERKLAGEGVVAPAVPALGEPPLVLLNPFGRRVVRRVAGPRGEVQEEGQCVVDRAQVPEEFDGAVGEVGAQVIAVLDGTRWPDDVVVVVEPGNELVRLAAVKPVPAVEAASEWPRGPRLGHVGLVLGAQMPLADGVGRVPVGPEDLRQEAVLAGRPAPVPGEAAGQVGDAPHATAVVVAAREEARPRG